MMHFLAIIFSPFTENVIIYLFERIQMILKIATVFWGFFCHMPNILSTAVTSAFSKLLFAALLIGL